MAAVQTQKETEAIAAALRIQGCVFYSNIHSVFHVFIKHASHFLSTRRDDTKPAEVWEWQVIVRECRIEVF